VTAVCAIFKIYISQGSVSGGSTLGPGGHRPPNLAQPPRFLDTVVLLLVELIGSIVNFA